MILIMILKKPPFALLFAFLLVLAACGSDDTSEVSAAAPAATEAAPAEGTDDDEDHDDEDHEDEGAAGLGAHEHGAGDLFVAWSGNAVAIDLISPANNLFGFEYEAETDEDIAIVDDALNYLSGSAAFAFNDEAGCSPDDDANISTEAEGTHSEVTASWEFTCENPESLTELDATGLFEQFPRFEDIDAQWASDSGQSAAELSASAPVLRFEYCLLYTSPSPRDATLSRMPSSA